MAYYELPSGDYYTFARNLIDGNDHILIAGATGSGKSVCLNSIIYSALQYKFPFYNDSESINFIFIDPKGVDLMIYEKLPHTIMYEDTVEGAIHALSYASDIIDERKADMKSRGIRTYDGTPIYIVVDELADLLLSEYGKYIMRLLQHITQIGRAEKVFLIACSQSPSRKILKAEFVLNMNVRIALRCNSPIESRQILDECGAEDLPRYGQAIIKRYMDSWIQIIPLVSDEDIQKRVNEWVKQKKANESLLPRLSNTPKTKWYEKTMIYQALYCLRKML